MIKRMTRVDYEPLIDRTRTRFLSWANKMLSYAGRLQLIKVVIVSITNFWCAAFSLPKRCFKLIESMCFAFLWTGSPHDTKKVEGSMGWCLQTQKWRWFGYPESTRYISSLQLAPDLETLQLIGVTMGGLDTPLSVETWIFLGCEARRKGSWIWKNY